MVRIKRPIYIRMERHLPNKATSYLFYLHENSCLQEMSENSLCVTQGTLACNKEILQDFFVVVVVVIRLFNSDELVKV